ncbi:MAG: hypothetical protein CM15mV22_1750 [Eurybiavirus sp.]|nr:MAG: hypothetical protein CM15mV22_1750 [Eurybiavirus sp.]
MVSYVSLVDMLLQPKSASNFGTYSLRATGFRAEAYSFDVGVIDSVTNELDGNGTETGRQVIQVSGTINQHPC